MRVVWLTMICGSIAGTSLPARADVLSDEQLLALDSLRELLVTDIATKTRPLDPDLAPGTVLVLNSGYLKRMGVQRLIEALEWIPGVTKQGRYTSPIVRGFGGISSTASGKIKYQLDGVPFNEVASASDAGLLNLSIDAIDRIEVIRGPGSAVHGEYALAAVVDIVTKSTPGISARIGSGDNRAADIIYASDVDSVRSWHIAGGVERQTGQKVNSGPDFASIIDYLNPASSNAPGSVYEPFDNAYVFGKFHLGGWTLNAHWLDMGQGAYYGTTNFLPNNPKDIVSRDETLQIRIAYDYDLFDSLEWSTVVDYVDHRRQFTNNQAFPAGFFNFYPETVYADSNESQQTWRFQTSATWFQSDRATLSGGFGYEDIYSDEALLLTNQDIENFFFGLPLPSPVELRFAIGYEDIARYISSVHVQQELSFTSGLTLTAGLRYDRYSDIGENFSPRLAAVYKLNDSNIVKFSIGDAFRAPSLAELYNVTHVFQGNRGILPETVVTSELSYIYRQPSSRIELTVFETRYNDVIGLMSVPGQLGATQFDNLGDYKSQGFELSGEHSFDTHWSLAASVSYSDADRDSSADFYSGSSDILMSGSVEYQMSRSVTLVSSLNYVGERSRQAGDPRDDLAGYNLVNLTATWLRAPMDTTLRLTVKNVFDTQVKQPSLPDTYPEDYPRDGRGFYLSIAKTF